MFGSSSDDESNDDSTVSLSFLSFLATPFDYDDDAPP